MEMTPALIVTPHPVTLQGQRKLGAAVFEPGEYLEALLKRQGIQPCQQWVVSIDGVDVPEQHWHRVRPKHGYLIEARRVPERDVLRIVAIAALSYFTFGAGGVAGGGFLGLTGTAATFAAGAAYLAGSLVINKLLAPKTRAAQQEGTTSPTYSLSGGRNRARPFEPLALVLGEPYSVPDVGAQPYTFFANGEQYLWQIFNLGINCAEASSLRIGQTALSNYQGVTVLRNGLASGNTTFPALGTSVDSIGGAVLEAPSSPGAWVERTSSAGTVRLAVDLVGALFAIGAGGVYVIQECDVGIEYRAVGSGTWLPFVPGVAGVDAITETTLGYWGGTEQTYFTRVITPAVAAIPPGVHRLRNASQKPIRATLELAVPAGQYEVRMRKVSVDYTGTAGSNAVEWVSLKSYQQDTANYDGQARLAVQIQASGQLNGSLDELNAALRAKPMPYWNGASWVTATDRASGLCNPGAIFLLLARGIYDTAGRRLAGLGYSDDQIDIAGLQAFMVSCAAKGFEFDLNVQDNMSIDDLLEAVAYAGMGEKSWPDGKLGVTFYSADDPIEGVINMANIKARSFEVSYDTMPTADEIEFQYFDRSRGYKWTSLRITAPDVTLPRSTARVSLIGITGEAHAATLARFSMAQNIYQRKTVTCGMDLEYLTVRKGSVVSLSHDMTQWGYSGRLLACEDSGGTITLTLDDIAPETNPLGGGTPYIGLRLPGETQMRVFAVASVSPNERTVTLTGSWPGGATLPGSTAANPARDTLWVYDFKAVPGQKLQVVAIEPSMNGARLTMVPVSDAFWTYVQTGAYTPPPNNSLLRAAPEVTFVNVSETLARQGNTYYTELSVNFEVSGAFSRAELWGAVGEGEQSPTLVKLAESRSQTMSWRGGLDERWHLEIRVYGEIQAGDPYRLYYDVLGLREPPPNVEAISVSGDTISWTPVSVPDLAGYLLRFNYGANPWWESATPLHDGLITETPYSLIRRPQGLVTMLVKAIDTTGNESADPVWVSYVFPEVLVENVLLDYPQDPTFSGTIEGGSVISGELVADDTDAFWEPSTAPLYGPAVDDFYLGSQYSGMSYEFSVSPSEPGTLALIYDIAAEGFLIEYQTGGGEDFYATPDTDPFWEPADELLYGTPSAWTVWPGSIDVDGTIEVRFRITLAGGETQGVISQLSAVLDVPDVLEEMEDIAISSGGTRLPITATYNVIRTVQLTVQNDGSGGISARVIDKNPTLGPLVEILNAAGTAVNGVLDAQVQGY